jgi:hypothetical protein
MTRTSSGRKGSAFPSTIGRFIRDRPMLIFEMIETNLYQRIDFAISSHTYNFGLHQPLAMNKFMLRAFFVRGA